MDKNDLKKLKKFLTNNPERAKDYLKKDPELLNLINSLVNDKTSGREMGYQKSLSIPGVPKNLFVKDERNDGFSNYLFLAVIAFTIQFVMMLVCILFYK